jgi:hypothetical protein
VSSTVLQRGGISFAEGVNPSPPNCVQVAEKKLTVGDQERRRRRRSSSLMYHEPPEDLEQLSDQKANPNLNANWVNMKGAWVIHVVIILLLKILYDIVPSISQETSWTMVNISYMFGSYLMFHYVRGVPFEFNAGAYDNLNMWEQIDNGDQYTPAKKFLLSVPICLFLVSTHYTHYDLTYFMINFMATVMVVVPKLPAVSPPCAVNVSPQNVTLTAPSSSTDSASPYSTKSRCSGSPKKSQSGFGSTQGSFGAAFGHTSRKKIGRFPCLYYGTTSYTTCQQRPFACCALLPFLLRYHSCFDFAGHRFLYYIN